MTDVFTSTTPLAGIYFALFINKMRIEGLKSHDIWQNVMKRSPKHTHISQIRKFYKKYTLAIGCRQHLACHLRNMIMSYKLSSSCTWWSLNSAEKSLLCWMWCDVNGQGADAEMTGEGGRGRKASCTSGGERVWTNQSADSSQAAVCSANQEQAHSEDYWYYCDMDNVWLLQ